MAAILLALPQCMESIGCALDTPQNAYMKAEDKKNNAFFAKKCPNVLWISKKALPLHSQFRGIA